jgi:hypothetical protein
VTGPWRVLMLDRDPDDPRWLLATVTLPSDVRPAVLDAAGRYTDWAEVTAWVRGQLGHASVLLPVHDALAWTVTASDIAEAIAARQEPLPGGTAAEIADATTRARETAVRGQMYS